MDAVEAIAVDGRSSPGEDNPLIIDEAKEQLEESPASLQAAMAKGPITVLGACEEERRLIALVRRHPALYDARHPRFRDDDHKEQLWQRIASGLKIELTQCLMSWSELRYRYQQHVRRLRAFHRSAAQRGETLRRRPCLRHEEELLFLYPHVARFPRQMMPEAAPAAPAAAPAAPAPAPAAPAAAPAPAPAAAPAAPAPAAAPVETEPEEVIDVETVDLPPGDIIDVDSVEDATAFRCTSEHRRLIEAVSAYPQLYDPLHPQYANFRHRGLIWGSIANELSDKATKLMKSWLTLQIRYEWEVTHSPVHCSESELCQQMSFLRAHVLNMRSSVCKTSKYLSNGWHSPIDNFRSVLALINAMRTMLDHVQIVEECMKKDCTKPARYDELWLAVDKKVGLGPERCEVTWLVLRTFHNELLAMRHAGYQLQDKWYFENALSGIVRLVAVRALKRGAIQKRSFNGEVSSGAREPPAKRVMLPSVKLGPLPQPVKKVPQSPAKQQSPTKQQSPAKLQPPTKLQSPTKLQPPAKPPQEPPRLPIAIVYPPAMKKQNMLTPRSSSTNISPELPLQTFVIPTTSGAVRVSHPAVQLPSPMKIMPIPPPLPNTVRLFPHRPGLQITRCQPPRMPLSGQMHPVVRPRYNPPVSALGALLSEPPATLPPPTLPQMAKLLPSTPVVRILHPGPNNDWEPWPSTSLPVLSPAKAGAGAGASNPAAGGEGRKSGAPISITVYPEKAGASLSPPRAAPAPTAAAAASPKIIRATATVLPPSPARNGAPPAEATPAAAPPASPAATPPKAAPLAAGAAPPAAAAPLAASPPKAAPLAAGAAPPAAAPPAASPPKAAPPAAAPPKATPPATAAAPSVDPVPSTSKNTTEIRTDFGANPPGVHMSAINVNLVHSASAGNSLHIWGGGLHCQYHLNMVRTATLIREVMAVPQLHSKDPQLKTKCDGFWQIISQKFHMPEVALRACWHFLANNMSVFPLIAPMFELMRPFKGGQKVWEKSHRLFSKFDEIARKYDWMKHKDVMPELIRHFRSHEHLYWELRKPRPGEPEQSPRQYTDKERQAVWREARIKFPDLNHHDIWSMFKFAFRTYMEDLERGIENPWPQNWWQALEQLKFLADVHYHPLEPYYYIVHNKILEEVKRCSMFEALACSDSGDKSKTTALLARVSKEPMPWCSEEAKRLLTGQLSSFPATSQASGGGEAPAALAKLMPEPKLIPPPRRQKQNAGRRPAYTLPTIGAFELTRMLRRYPHTFLKAPTVNKRTAWVRVSKELKITVTECRLGLQYAVREMRILKILDPNNACTMGHKYYRHMDDIFKQVKRKSSLTVRTPQQMNQSISISEPPEAVEPHKFVPEINMSTCKPGLVLKNWAYAVGNLSKESQDNLTPKLTQLFAKYAKCAKTGTISLGTKIS